MSSKSPVQADARPPTDAPHDPGLLRAGSRVTREVRHAQIALSVDSVPVNASATAGIQRMQHSTGPLETAFLTLPKAADHLGLSPNALYVWRHRRQGPPSFRMGRRVMYRVSALDAWVRAQEQADSRSNPALNPLACKPQRRARSLW
ncbi:helix-turn-helix transcriptional regulator [Streptomyces sp. NPDC014889]|uniref:helix-turn-helix transcriptional regulator n=1 Tax=Streptomyces sp. NPDC014889 TaxID=3364928 RepID=UPI0036FFEB09